MTTTTITTPAIVAGRRSRATTHTGVQLLADIEAYLTRYVAFASPDYPRIAALWLIMTYLWEQFDAIPYVVITSATKRSGKTRFAEVLSYVACRARQVSGVSAASIYHMIKEIAPTLILDEAESLGSEARNILRAVINTGYRRGQTVPRIESGIITYWPVYGPKVFVLIGDPYDTLRDRSVVFEMERHPAPHRFLYDVANREGAGLARSVKAFVTAHRAAILDIYRAYPLDLLSHLTDRDAEIWVPLFAIASACDPGSLPELQRAAAEMSSAKTARKRRYGALQRSEVEVENAAYARQLVRDLRAVIAGEPTIFTSTALERLHALPLAPWKRFRGHGLDSNVMGRLLGKYCDLRPRIIRETVNGRRTGVRARGFDLASIVRAATLAADVPSD